MTDESTDNLHTSAPPTEPEAEPEQFRLSLTVTE